MKFLVGFATMVVVAAVGHTVVNRKLVKQNQELDKEINKRLAFNAEHPSEDGIQGGASAPP